MKNRIDGTTWNDSLLSAIRAYRLGDLDLAEQRLDRAFKIGGRELPSLYLLAGHIALSRGALIEAEKAWKKVLKLNPENAEAWNNLGVLHRRYGDDVKALAAFQEAEERSKDRPDIPYNIGNLHKSAGRLDEAISAYNRAIEISPGYAPAFNNLGTLYDMKKERAKALEVFRRGLTADGRDASLRFNLGLIYQEEERWEDARESFDQALKSRPGWVPGLNNLGIVLQEMGREDDAARTFRTLLDIEPENVSALNNLGVSYGRLGRTSDARACFRRALAEEPGYLTAALNLHDSYHDNQELNEALEEINKQITHHPADPEIRIRMARTLMGLTRWDDAERSLDHVLERNPRHPDAMRTKADLYLSTKRPDEAEALLKKLPHDPKAVRDLAKLNITTGKPEKAEKILSELIAADPGDLDSRRILSELIAEERPEEALKQQEEVVASSRDSTGDLISLATLYGRTGQKDRALGLLDQAVNVLGSRGEPGDLDEMNEVLALYEKAASDLDEEKGQLFLERITQLGRKLQSTSGRTGENTGRKGRIISEEIPMDEGDALSLLDINAMEPVIRINEEEETVFLEESAENLEDEYTELYRREPQNDDSGQGYATGPPAGGGYPPLSPADRSGGGSGGGGDFGGRRDGGAGSGITAPPVHIHLPAQAYIPPAPQVIYQDVRPVTYQMPPEKPQTPPERIPEVSVKPLVEEEVPAFPEPAGDTESMEISLEEKEDFLDDYIFADLTENKPDDDGAFQVPDSDALSEDLPDTVDSGFPGAELVFSDENEPENLPENETAKDGDTKEAEEYEGIDEFEEFDEPLLLDEEEFILLPDQVAPDGDSGESEYLPVNEGRSGAEDPDITSPPSAEDAPKTDKMTEMFKYLSELADATTGDGRKQLIEKGVPLKLAGIHARLAGEPKLREVAQKFDRRRRERHNLELDEKKIRESLDAFKSLAEAYPNQSVGQSLSQKLGRIMSFVSKKVTTGEKD